MLVLSSCKINGDTEIRYEMIETNEKSTEEEEERRVDFWPFYDYELLLLSFQDDSGNDLIKGIGYDWWQSDIIPEEEATKGTVDDDLFTLDYVYPDSCLDGRAAYDMVASLPGVIFDEYKGPGLVLVKENKKYFFEFSLSCIKLVPFGDNYNFYPPAEMITIKISCPHVFGSKEVHEIVTHWKLIDIDSRPIGYNKDLRYCYYIEFDGKEISIFQERVFVNEEFDVGVYATIANIVIKN